MSGSPRTRLLVVGVGGQGVITAARIIGEAAMLAGIDPMVGQLHGMSQRGGSVEAPVLLGAGRSAHLEDHAADLVLGFEPLETLRALPRMSASTRVVVNLGTVVPVPLSLMGRDYPDVDGILDQVAQVAPDVVRVDGPALLDEVGNAKAINFVMLGVLAGLGALPFDSALLWRAAEQRIPRRYQEINRRAYRAGRASVHASR